MKKKYCKGCNHLAVYHYVSEYIGSFGQIFCGKDNCTMWQNCEGLVMKDLPEKAKH